MTETAMFPCPSCGLALPLGDTSPPACPRCLLILVGPLAAELAAVDRELAGLRGGTADLETRRRQLLFELRELGASSAAVSPWTRAAPATGSALPIQLTLLGLGALLLSIAGVVFGVVAYGRLGIGGRAAILVGVTAVAAASTVVLHRRELTQTADAVGVLTLALLTLDLHAVRLLAGPGWDPSAWWALVAASVAVLGCTAGARLTLGATSAVGVAVGQLALPLAAVALVDAVSGSRRAEGVAVVCALVVTAVADLTGARRTMAMGWAGTARRLALAAGVGELVAGGLFAAGLAFDSGSARDALPGALALLMVAGGLAWAARLAAAPAAAGLLTAPADGVAPLAAAASAVAVLAAVSAVFIRPLEASTAAPSTVLLLPASLGVLLCLVALRLPTSVRPGPLVVGAATTASAVAVDGTSLLAGLTAPFGLLAHPWPITRPSDVSALVRLVAPDGVGGADVLLLLLAAVSALVAAKQWGRRPRTSSAVLIAAAVLLVPAAAGLSVLVALVGLLLVVGALVCGALAAPGIGGRSGRRDVEPAMLLAAPFAATALALSAVDPALTLLTVAVVGLLAGAAALRSRGAVSTHVTVGGAVAASACALAWAPVAVLASGGTAVAAGVVLAAVAAVGLVAVDRPTPGPARSAVLGVGAVAAALGLTSTHSDPVWLSLVLTGLGVAGLAGALRPGRQGLAAAGTGAFALASWVRLVDLHVTTPEAYTLPSAAVAIVVGEVVRRRRPDLDLDLLLGPGLSLALVPSLLVSLGDDGAVRPLLLTVGAFAVVVAGSSLRLRAPLLIGGGVLAAVALRQLGPLAVQAPRWVLLGSVGLLLLVLGARYERTRAEVERLRRSFAELG